MHAYPGGRGNISNNLVETKKIYQFMIGYVTAKIK